MKQPIAISSLMRHISIPVIVMLLLASAASGDDGKWLTVRDDERTSYLLDLKIVSGDKSPIRASRMKRIFKQGDDDRAYALDTIELDCNRNLYRFTNIVILDRDNLVTHRYTFADQSCPVPPNSYIQSVYELVCATPSPR